jgi:hypothetical protein
MSRIRDREGRIKLISPTHCRLEKGLYPIHDLRLVIEQPLFTPEAAAVADEVAFGADDAVAGNDDDDIVLAVRGGRGADGLGIAEAAGEFEIAERFPEGDGGEFGPNALLEGGTFLADGEVEDAALSLEILDQLFDALDDEGRDGALEAGVFCFGCIEVVDEADLVDVGRSASHAEQSQGGLVVGRGDVQRS